MRACAENAIASTIRSHLTGANLPPPPTRTPHHATPLHATSHPATPRFGRDLRDYLARLDSWHNESPIQRADDLDIPYPPKKTHLPPNPSPIQTTPPLKPRTHMAHSHARPRQGPPRADGGQGGALTRGLLRGASLAGGVGAGGAHTRERGHGAVRCVMKRERERASDGGVRPFPRGERGHGIVSGKRDIDRAMFGAARLIASDRPACMPPPQKRASAPPSAAGAGAHPRRRVPSPARR